MRPRALVTGGGARVGRAIALELAHHGFDLAVHYRSRSDEAADVAAECRAAGAQAFVVAGDLGRVEDCEAVCTAIGARWDSLQLLVNNASVFPRRAFEDIEAEAWDEVLAINLRAPFLLSRGLLPLLRAGDPRALGAPAGQHGVVVHLCDIGGDRPINQHCHYSVSKAGLLMLVRTMAIELAPAIRTVGVSPGQVAWPEHYTDDKRAALARRIPLGRAGEPADIARLVRFVALEGHYLNGVSLAVDGGLGARY